MTYVTSRGRRYLTISWSQSVFGFGVRSRERRQCSAVLETSRSSEEMDERMMSHSRGICSSLGGRGVRAVTTIVAAVRQFLTAGIASSAALSLWEVRKY